MQLAGQWQYSTMRAEYNHEPSLIVRAHPIHRRRIAEENEDIHLLRGIVGTSNRIIASILYTRRQDSLVSTYDIKNERQRHRIQQQGPYIAIQLLIREFE
jgi:hypothetical protein